MNLLKIIKKKIKRILNLPDYNLDPIKLPTFLKKTYGTVLFSYLDFPLSWQPNDSRFDGHSNLWESREIVKIFNEFGFNVEAVSWTNSFFYPKKEYEVIFDIHTNLQRWAPFLQSSTKKILHLTGSYFKFQRDAELARVADLEKRSGMFYSPKRIPADLDLAERSHRFADACSLIGNKITLQTYPDEYQKKITMIPVSASHLSVVKKVSHEYVPAPREFLWFYGGGAVHKGLDLVLEVFAKNPEYKLHVVAKLETERDFFRIYGNHFALSNITYHGYLHPSSHAFQEIAARVFANIAPSCSEGISPAAVTCMQYGFYPIISFNNGITLPHGAGMYLKSCSLDEIEESIIAAYNMPKDSLIDQIRVCQNYAQAEYSRENFSQKMRSFLMKALEL